MGFARLFLLLAFLSSLSTKSIAQSSFKCSSPATCHALVGYVPVNSSTITEIETLFNVKNLRSLLGANNLDPSTPRNYTFPQNKTVKVPIPCICYNNTGVSNRVPIYKVQKDDGLYHIAADVFSGLLKYQEIARVNRIADPDLIKVGQELWIPLPCSCDDVDGQKVVHYAHLVEEGSSVEQIAEQFGTDKDTLLKLNGIANDSQLIAAQAFDVPLKACSSSIRNDSLDSTLLVANGTYHITANGCVKCMCDSANNWTLQCEPSQFKPVNWSSCPSMLCPGSESFYIGNSTLTTCTRTSCAYAGYNSQTIVTTPVTVSTCPISTPNSGALRIGSSWNFHFISLYLLLLCFSLFQ